MTWGWEDIPFNCYQELDTSEMFVLVQTIVVKCSVVPACLRKIAVNCSTTFGCLRKTGHWVSNMGLQIGFCGVGPPFDSWYRRRGTWQGTCVPVSSTKLLETCFFLRWVFSEVRSKWVQKLAHLCLHVSCPATSSDFKPIWTVATKPFNPPPKYEIIAGSALCLLSVFLRADCNKGRI
jgi:hypothetical protein